MGLIFLIILALVAAGLLTRYTRLTPPTQTPCHGNCNQGRNCDCVPKIDHEKHRLDDEFNNANWPFPTAKKP